MGLSPGRESRVPCVVDVQVAVGALFVPLRSLGGGSLGDTCGGRIATCEGRITSDSGRSRPASGDTSLCPRRAAGHTSIGGYKKVRG
jgi:hypothetical protein